MLKKEYTNKEELLTQRDIRKEFFSLCSMEHTSISLLSNFHIRHTGVAHHNLAKKEAR